MRRRWIYIDGVAVEVTEDMRREPKNKLHFLPDIQPYRSTVTGEMITSRSKHRELLRQHNLTEIGNEIGAHIREAERRPSFSREQRKRDIANVINNR